MAKKTPTIEDKCVVYWSRQDSMWVSHSLRTDQIGVGGCVLDALVDLMKGVNSLLAIAAEDETVKVLREAPARIQNLAKNAEPLPKELYEIAYRKVHGDWPEVFKKVNTEVTKKTVLTANVMEPI